MKYILYLIVGLAFSSFAQCDELSTTPFKKVAQQNAAQMKTDKITMIAGLPWHFDIETAYALAIKEKKKVIIMVGEDYCKWCTKMKEKTFTDQRVMEKLQKYVLVSVKRSDKSAIKYVPSFDGNIPSLFFMTTERELIDAVVGYFIPKDFLSYIDEIEEQ